MSLTFEFPQWQLCVTSSPQEDISRENGAVAGDGTDWAADLQDLDSDGYETADGCNDAGVAQGPCAIQQHDVFGLTATTGISPCPAASARDLPASLNIADDEGQPVALVQQRSIPYSPAIAQLGLEPAATAALQPAKSPCPAAMAVNGDSIPAEVLLLVLSELHDVADCVRAALVCQHWLAVVHLSNELWFELHSLHLAKGTWHRPPHAGRPLLRPPPGAGHVRSRMLSYKTTCALTQVAVRFMALRKGFEYVVEAAAALWLAAHRAAAGTTTAGRPPDSDPGQQQLLGEPPLAPDGPPARQQPSAGSDGHIRVAAAGGAAATSCGVVATQLSPPAVGAATGAGGGGGDGGHGGSGSQAADSAGVGVARGTGSAGGGSGGGSGSRRGQRQRITHVDQLWESCGRSRTALQVDERFNAVRVQQMVGKLCCSGGGQWLPLYEGVAAVMASRCDEVRDELTHEAAAARAAREVAADVAAAAAMAPSTAGRRQQSPASRSGGGNGSVAGGGGGGNGSSRPRGQPQFRGEVVYGGSSYADRFAELLRRGDTRGALALGAEQQRRYGTASGDDGDDGGGGGAMHCELDEPEMREVVEVGDCNPLGDRSGYSAAVGPAVEEGLLLWRLLLRAWAVYRRWLEVWVVWCGPLGARVEAERQLAGAAAAHGEAPLAPPHLTNKGLLLFRSQVLLAYPVRRPLQAAALWLSARAAQGEGEGCGGGGSGEYEQEYDRCTAAGGRRLDRGVGEDGGDGPLGLSEEQAQLLIGIRKALTELAVPDDATQPPHLHTRQKLQRCFGRLLLRPVPGGTRALLAAQRLHGTRGGGGGGGG